MREVPLTRGKVALVDDEDYERVIAAGSWCAIKDGNTYYAIKGIMHPDGGRLKSGRKRKTTIRMHTFITGIKQVDHVDRNGLNNQKHNLREATKSQNAQNLKSTTGTSIYKGVYWDENWQKWVANIRFNGKTKNLGGFKDEKQAALVYDKRARELFGEFALTNFPLDVSNDT